MKRVVEIAIFGLLVMRPVGAQASVIEWAFDDGGNGHFYELVEDSLNWDDARDAASARSYLGASGHLATFTSAEENAFVVANWIPNHQWIGLFQYDKLDEPAGHWRWVTEEPFVYNNWFSPQEPNESGGPEDWAAFGSTDHSDGSLPGQWQDWKLFGDSPSSDIFGRNRPNGYFVEYAPVVPEPSTILLMSSGLLGLVVARRKRLGRSYQMRKGHVEGGCDDRAHA